MGLDPDDPLVLYVGSLAPGRGLEVAIDAVAHLPDAVFAVAGPSSDQRYRDLKSYADRAGISGRFKILNAVRESQVVDLLSLADVSVIPVQATCESYRLCLPNKIFQSLAAGTPVVSTPLPEVAAIIGKIKHCRVASDFTSQALAESLMSALFDNDDANVSMPDGLQPNALLARYVTLAEALLGDYPVPDFSPLAHAKDATRAAARDQSWTPEKALFCSIAVRAVVLATSLGSSNRAQEFDEA